MSRIKPMLKIIPAAGLAAAVLPVTAALAAPWPMAGHKNAVHYASGAAATSGRTGEVRLGNGRCVDDRRNGTRAGDPVAVETCRATTVGERWTVRSDGTLTVTVRRHTFALDVTAAHRAVIEPYPDSDATARWLPAASGQLVNLGLGGPQHLKALNDPGDSRRLGTQLTVAYATRRQRERFTVPGTTYATSRLTNHADSGGGGDNWALDTITRQSSATFLGRPAGGPYSYEGSIVDSGTFETVPGNLTPNQGLDKGKTLGDALSGPLTGTWGYPFTSTALVSARARPVRSMNGYGKCDPAGNGVECTGNWFDQFFARGTTFTGLGANGTGPEQWSWSYSGRDNCGRTEKWVDANNDNDGQNSTGLDSTDITAPLAEDCTG